MFTVEYRASDNAGNVEALKTQTHKIDKTPPELATSCGPPVGNLVVVGVDAGSGIASSVLISVTPEPQGQLKERRTYPITDVAGNTLKAVFGFRQEGNELRASLFSVSYNDGVPIVFVQDINEPQKGKLPNLLKCEWAFNGSTLRKLEQRLEIEDPEVDVRAEFSATTNQTEVRVSEPEPEVKITLPGVVFLKLTTNLGVLGFAF